MFFYVVGSTCLKTAYKMSNGGNKFKASEKNYSAKEAISLYYP